LTKPPNGKIPANAHELRPEADRERDHLHAEDFREREMPRLMDEDENADEECEVEEIHWRSWSNADAGACKGWACDPRRVRWRESTGKCAQNAMRAIAEAAAILLRCLECGRCARDDGLHEHVVVE
jgi:hypothetical protein